VELALNAETWPRVFLAAVRLILAMDSLALEFERDERKHGGGEVTALEALTEQ
jgi:hypothetical protein